jgi:hypothetical protein
MFVSSDMSIDVWECVNKRRELGTGRAGRLGGLGG